MNLLERLKAAARVVWRGTLTEATVEEIFGTPVPIEEYLFANGRPLRPVARVYGPDTRPEKNATLRTLQDHDLVRNRSRILAETNPNAAGLLDRVVAYVVGRGSSTEVQSAVEGADPPKRLSRRVTDFVQKFKRQNQWPAREKEVERRLHVDGEFFLRFFPHPDGTTRVRFVEAANVRPPLGEDAEGPWSFGIYTPGGDSEEPTHYCVHDFRTNTDEIVEAHFVIHGKINCLSNQKRGVPSLYACEGDLTGAAKLRHATREGEKNRASINYFRRHKAASEGTMRAFRESQARAVGLLADPSAPDNASQVYVEIIQPGSTIDIPEGLDPLPPPGSPNVQGSATSVEQAMEAVAARFGVPVWVVSGKTDQGNFAQSLVVESPFTVTVEDAQSSLAEWSDQAQTKAIEIAVEQGLLPEDVLDVIDLAVSFPSPVSRNQMEQTQRCKILRDSNIISEREWAVEEGYDPEKQRQQILEERRDQIGALPTRVTSVPVNPITGQPAQQTAPQGGPPNGAAPSSTPAARYAQMAGRLREQADEMLRLAEAEWSEGDHPRDERGRWAEAAAAMAAAHPFPPPRDLAADPPGLGRPDLVAKDPALQKALAARDAHGRLYHRAFVAATVHKMLTERPPRAVPLPGEDQIRVSRAKRAIERAAEARQDADTLTDHWRREHHGDVAASHPQGAEALEAARAEARRRLAEQHASALAHVEALPPGLREKGRRHLAAAMGEARLHEQAGEFDALAEGEFNEEDHPRDYHGRFGSGGAPEGGAGKEGGAKAPPPEAKAEAPRGKADDPKLAKMGLWDRIKAALADLGFIGKVKVKGPPWKEVAHLTPAERMANSPPREEFIAELGKDRWRQTNWEHYAGLNGVTVEEARKVAAGKMNKYVEAAEPAIRINLLDSDNPSQPDLSVIHAVLDEGVFKNQFFPGIKSKRALNDRPGRNAAEDRSMGVPTDAPYQNRPCYGYLKPGKDGPADERVHEYGHLKVNLKKSVKERSTYSFGDSLMGAKNGEFVSAAGGEMHPDAIHPVHLARDPGILDDPKALDSELYVEVHVHDGMSATDIESVEWPKQDYGPMPDSLKQRLAEHKIPWSEY